MKQPPVIIVQIIHIMGPMKGDIQEFSRESISVGRHTSSHVRFPADLNIISRQHAEIVREGNQFKLIDHSANGTFVNGKRITEVYLKNGDVLMFAEGGPKVSFLTQMKEAPVEAGAIPSPQPRREEPQKPVQKEPAQAIQPPPVEKPVVQPVMEKPAEICIQRVNVPLVIQYGPSIRSYKEVPVTIGKHPGCGFVLDHPAIYDQHVQVFFTRDQYWVKDLTGQGAVRINRQSVGLQSPLKLNDEIALSAQGPTFRFLGEGRLLEVAEYPAEKPADSFEREVPRQENVQEKEPEGLLSKFKKIWKP